MSNLIKLITKKSLPIRSFGSSMAPIFQNNDLIYFRKISFSKIKINDIIVFKKKGKLITHRVIYKAKNYLISKGDNNLKTDGKIYPYQIIGKVYQIKRNNQIFNPETLYLIQSTHYFNEIVKIKKEFDRKKINYVFLKGLPLHLYFEGMHPKRIYADCDVLVDKKDFEKAQKILFKFNYKKADSSLNFLQKKLKDKEVENTYFKIINNFPVVFDLHIEAVFMMTQLGKLDPLYPQTLIDQLTAEFLKNKKKVKIHNEDFLILNSEYLILYLTLHLFHHNFRGPFRYQFLDTVINKSFKKNRNCHAELVSASQKSNQYQISNIKYQKYKSNIKNNKSQFLSLTGNRLRNPFRLRVTSYVTDSRYGLPNRQTLNELIIKYRLQNFVYPVFFLLKKYYQTPIPYYFLKSIKPNNLTIQQFNNLNIFDDESRLKAGINRFLNLVFLSPRPFWKKILVFLNPQVIFAVLWSIYKKIKAKF